MVIITYVCRNCENFFHFEIKPEFFECVHYETKNDVQIIHYEYNEVFPNASLFNCPICKSEEHFIITN